jgi:hypothetical protein
MSTRLADTSHRPLVCGEPQQQGTQQELHTDAAMILVTSSRAQQEQLVDWDSM